MRLLDRYIIKNFLVNFVLALTVLVGLFILFDLIVNAHDFARGAVVSASGVKGPSPTIWDIAGDIGDYYLYQLPVIFQQVSGIIPLLAAGFTMVRMTRHHELTAMMASGVSLYRVAAPIILISMCLAVVNVFNQELLISQPAVIEKLLRRHDEVEQIASKNEPLIFIKDTVARDNQPSPDLLLSAREYFPSHAVPISAAAPNKFTRASGSFIADGIQKDFIITTSGFQAAADNGDFVVTDVTDNAVTIAANTLVPEASASSGGTMAAGATMTDIFIVERDATGVPIRHTLAATAHWETPADAPQGVWMLRGDEKTGHRVVTEDDTGPNPEARSLPLQEYRNHLTPEQIELVLSKKAVDYLSSARVAELAQSSPPANRQLLDKIRHLRITQPLLNIILLLIGIPFLLTREPRRLVINMFLCVMVTGIIFIASFVLFQMAGTQIDPLWGAWLPILIFGPFALVMQDTIKT